MKRLFLTLLVLTTIICCNNVFAQAFIKSYKDPSNPNASVSFECITEKADSSGNFYIGGHIDNTLTVFKVNTFGNVLSTFKINASPANTRFDAIMIDASGLIAGLGNIQTSGANQGFIFQLNPLGTVIWFRQTNAANRIVYWDMSDKFGKYYLVSAERQTNGSALILKILKATGATSVAFNYIVTGLEDPEAFQLFNSKIYATGRYALGGSTNGFRSCLTSINTATTPYTHLRTHYYITPKYPTAIARLYTTDILMVNSNTAVIVGNGDDNNINDAFKNLNITKVNPITGVPYWSRKYDDPSAASDGSLTEVRLDNGNNYTVMGFAINPNTGSFAKAKLWSVSPANGNLLWNRQYDLYRRTSNTGSNYGYGFSIAGGYIYAVGQNATSGITQGVLLKVSTADGNVAHRDGTTCFDSLTIVKSKYTFYDSVAVTTLTSTLTAANSAKKVVQLKMNDSVVCGDVVNINRTANNGTKAQAYPNPFKNGFMLKLPAKSIADVQIINMQGLPQEIKLKATGNIQMGNALSYGVYSVIIKYSDGSTEQLKMIKNPD
ncbi:MAG: T9SS type A sorting domain-containing protein [Parafilimonas sp.]